jgi:hypothetical protein
MPCGVDDAHSAEPRAAVNYGKSVCPTAVNGRGSSKAPLEFDQTAQRVGMLVATRGDQDESRRP